MGLLDKVLRGFLGDKNAADLKEVKKVLTKIKAAEPKIQELTDDGLRAKTTEFKEKIKAATANISSQINDLKEQIKNPAMWTKKKRSSQKLKV